MALLKIEGHPDLVKDTKTGAILNINIKKANEDIARQIKLKNQILGQREIASKVEKMESEVSEMKGLLNKILEKMS